MSPSDRVCTRNKEVMELITQTMTSLSLSFSCSLYAWFISCMHVHNLFVIQITSFLLCAIRLRDLKQLTNLNGEGLHICLRTVTVLSSFLIAVCI